MEVISTPNAPSAIGPYSQAIKVNGMIYTSGQIALNKDGILIEGDVETQTRQVLENLKEVLKEGGSSFERVIKSTIYLSNMDDFGVVNSVYGEYFTTHLPARSTVAVKTLPKNVDVEIDLIALA
jgi:2-iminobutanoate/2-iminopropanoate deaminase